MVRIKICLSGFFMIGIIFFLSCGREMNEVTLLKLMNEFTLSIEPDIEINKRMCRSSIINDTLILSFTDVYSKALFLVNSMNKRILKIDLRNLQQKAQFSDTRIMDYQVVSHDSIYVLNWLTNRLALINFKGSVIKSWPILLPDELKNEGIRLIGKSSHSMMIFNDSIIIQYELSVYNRYYTTLGHAKKFFGSNIDILFNKNDSAFDFVKTIGKYPSYYTNGSFPYEWQSSRVRINCNLIYSFSMTDSFAITDLTNKLNWVYKGYDIKRSNLKLNSETIYNYELLTKHYVENDFYYKLIYDSKTKKLYQSILKGINYKKNENEVNRVEDKNVNLISYDLDLKREKEYHLESIPKTSLLFSSICSYANRIFVLSQPLNKDQINLFIYNVE